MICIAAQWLGCSLDGLFIFVNLILIKIFRSEALRSPENRDKIDREDL